ncbi:hypothetical protein E2C01_014748 [Portunus trituberculatus]|uniref:Uncharacterized protein n=1 Tax=Portunus trituberculatus TaxID=210409 RepID=A0A5B7DKU3_PORTR|nr:hypothetical protein [Portunus trituberculatus]
MILMRQFYQLWNGGKLNHLPDHVVENAPMLEVGQLHISVKAQDCVEGTHESLTKRNGPLAAQSREEPEPYSFPAKMITGCFSSR